MLVFSVEVESAKGNNLPSGLGLRKGHLQYSRSETHLNLGAQQAHTASLLDLVLSLLREVLGLDDDGTGGQVTTAQQLVVALQRNK